MIEIPSLLWQLDNLLPLVDFASIGSNDLVQFLFASDRGNPKLAGRYDPLSPAALGAMRMIVEAAARHGKPVTLCGELGGRPLRSHGPHRRRPHVDLHGAVGHRPGESHGATRSTAPSCGPSWNPC